LHSATNLMSLLR